MSPSPPRKEWVPIIREDIQSQRKLKQQPPLSDAYLSGMPAKRRKVRQEAALGLALLLWAEGVGGTSLRVRTRLS